MKLNLSKQTSPISRKHSIILSEPDMNLSGYLLLEQSDFLSNYVGSFQQLREDEELLDVTLVCEDETIEAHKVVLSACSSFFRNVLKKTKQNNPFIYLKGILHKDLVALLDYIYTGQAQVLAEDVDRFIQVGKDMQVKGLADEEKEVIGNIKTKVNSDSKTKELSDDSYDTTDADESINSLSNTKGRKPRKHKIKRKTEELSDKSNDNTDAYESETSLADETSFGENQETSLEIKKEHSDKEKKKPVLLLSELSKKIEKIKVEEGITMWKCTECGKILKHKGKLQMHVEIHLKGFSHTCSYCGKSHKTRNSLQAHKSTVHRGNK